VDQADLIRLRELLGQFSAQRPTLVTLNLTITPEPTDAFHLCHITGTATPTS
jgi:hypothetical protein